MKLKNCLVCSFFFLKTNLNKPVFKKLTNLIYLFIYFLFNKKIKRRKQFTIMRFKIDIY